MKFYDYIIFNLVFLSLIVNYADCHIMLDPVNDFKSPVHRKCNHEKKSFQKNYLRGKYDRKLSNTYYNDIQFQNLRMHFDYTYTLPHEETIIKELVMPPVKKFYESTLSVRRFPGKIRFPKTVKDCQGIPVPKKLQKEGVDADLVIIVSTYRGMKKYFYENVPNGQKAWSDMNGRGSTPNLNDYLDNFFSKNKNINPYSKFFEKNQTANKNNTPPWEINDSPGDVVGWSFMCVQDIYTLRPVAGVMQYVADIDPTPRAIEEAIWTTLHEIMHVLAMDFDLYSDFIDSDFNRMNFDRTLRMKTKLVGLDKILEERKDVMNDLNAFAHFNSTIINTNNDVQIKNHNHTHGHGGKNETSNLHHPTNNTHNHSNSSNNHGTPSANNHTSTTHHHDNSNKTNVKKRLAGNKKYKFEEFPAFIETNSNKNSANENTKSNSRINNHIQLGNKPKNTTHPQTHAITHNKPDAHNVKNNTKSPVENHTHDQTHPQTVHNNTFLPHIDTIFHNHTTVVHNNSGVHHHDNHTHEHVNSTVNNNSNNFTNIMEEMLLKLLLARRLPTITLPVGDQYYEIQVPKNLNLTVLTLYITNFLDHTKLYLKTPKVVEHGRKHFGCSSLEGVELEHFGGLGSSFSHWSKRILNTEFMIADSYGENYVSNLTLALLEDSGWYKVDYSKSENMLWGRNRGCEFLEDKCIVKKKKKNSFFSLGLSSSYSEKKDNTSSKIIIHSNVYDSDYKDEFCTSFEEEKCSITHIFRAVCAVNKFNWAIPKEYQYFDNPNVGGYINFGDYCPYPMEWTDPKSIFPMGSCRNGIKLRSEIGEKVCENCRCFHSSLVDEKFYKKNVEKLKKDIHSTKYKHLDDTRAACYEAKCRTDKNGRIELFINIEELEIKCPRGGALLTVDGYKGFIECPKVETVCTGTLDPKADFTSTSAYNLFSHLPEQLLNILYDFIKNKFK